MNSNRDRYKTAASNSPFGLIVFEVLPQLRSEVVDVNLNLLHAELREGLEPRGLEDGLEHNLDQR